MKQGLVSSCTHKKQQLKHLLRPRGLQSFRVRSLADLTFILSHFFYERTWLRRIYSPFLLANQSCFYHCLLGVPCLPWFE